MLLAIALGENNGLSNSLLVLLLLLEVMYCTVVTGRANKGRDRFKTMCLVLLTRFQLKLLHVSTVTLFSSFVLPQLFSSQVNFHKDINFMKLAFSNNLVKSKELTEIITLC